MTKGKLKNKYNSIKMTEEKLKQTCEVECLDNGYLLHDIDDGSKSAAIYSKEPGKTIDNIYDVFGEYLRDVIELGMNTLCSNKVRLTITIKNVEE